MLEITDLSTIHNFHLDARYAGVDVATDVAGTGEKTTIVVLRDEESYIYACDAHPATMNVTFSIHGAGYGRRTLNATSGCHFVRQRSGARTLGKRTLRQKRARFIPSDPFRPTGRKAGG